MKIYILFLGLLTIASINCKHKEKISKSENFNFYISAPNKVDTIIAGEVGKFDLFIENKNEIPVTILDIAQSCDCTNSEIQKGQKITENSLSMFNMQIHTDKANSNKKVDVSISIKTDLNPGIYSVTKKIFIK